jgi:DNA-directed RNA polymerase subunit RPC12/RpoP
MGAGAAVFVVALAVRVAWADNAGLWLALAGLGAALVVGGRRFIDVTACPMCGGRLLGSAPPRGTRPPAACASCGANFRLKWP